MNNNWVLCILIIKYDHLAFLRNAVETSSVYKITLQTVVQCHVSFVLRFQ